MSQQKQILAQAHPNYAKDLAYSVNFSTSFPMRIFGWSRRSFLIFCFSLKWCELSAVVQWEQLLSAREKREGEGATWANWAPNKKRKKISSKSASAKLLLSKWLSYAFFFAVWRFIQTRFWLLQAKELRDKTEKKIRYFKHFWPRESRVHKTQKLLFLLFFSVL